MNICMLVVLQSSVVNMVDCKVIDIMVLKVGHKHRQPFFLSPTRHRTILNALINGRLIMRPKMHSIYCTFLLQFHYGALAEKSFS